MVALYVLLIALIASFWFGIAVYRHKEIDMSDEVVQRYFEFYSSLTQFARVRGVGMPPPAPEPTYRDLNSLLEFYRVLLTIPPRYTSNRPTSNRAESIMWQREGF